MRNNQIFVSNYLSVPRFPMGKAFAFTIIIFCYFMSYLYWFNDIGAYLSANRTNAIDAGEFWRLVSSTFIHGNLSHFLSNSLMLFILSLVTVSFYGVVFSTIYIVFSGALINYLVLLSHSKADTYLVGASGVIFCLWGFWLILFFCIERQRTVLSRLLRIGAVFFVLLVPTSYDPATSYRAHYIGFLIGILAGAIYYSLLKQKITSFEVWRDKPSNYDDDGGLPWQLEPNEADLVDGENEGKFQLIKRGDQIPE